MGKRGGIEALLRRFSLNGSGVGVCIGWYEFIVAIFNGILDIFTFM